MVNWFMDTRRPRHGAGLTSAIYTGDTLDAIPMATPPAIRQTTNSVNVGAHPVSTEESAKIAAEAINSTLRPKRSAAAPATSEPNRHPNNAQLLAHPDLPRRHQVKEFLIERFGAADDYEVVAKEQATQCGDHRQQPNIARVELLLRFHLWLPDSGMSRRARWTEQVQFHWTGRVSANVIDR